MSSRQTAIAAGLLLLLVIAFFHETFLTGRTYFAGDLTYYWWPRKQFIAENLQRGNFPLWDPTFRAGLPFFANPDNGVLDAFALPFAFWPFAAALKLNLLAVFFSSALALFLLGKLLRWSNGASLLLAAVVVFGGYFSARGIFLSQASTLACSLWSVPLLLAGLFAASALSLALAIFAGHWQTAIIFWICALPLLIAARGARSTRAAGSAVAAAAIAAVLVLPALELARHSSWGTSGVAPAQAAVHSLAWGDLKFLLQSARVDWRAGLDNTFWTERLLLGWVPLLLAAWGFWKAPAKAKLLFGVMFAVSILLSLGWANARAPLLNYIRYPVRWMWGAVLTLSLLAAAGANRLNWKPRVAALILSALPLFAAWRGNLPTASANYFQARGALAEFLQSHLPPDQRFLFSPKAERLLAGEGPADLRDRLYVRTPLPYHLSQAGGFGEPLTPQNTDAALEDLFAQSSPDAARAWASRLAVSDLLSAEAWQTSYTEERGPGPWKLYHNPDALPRAYWVPEDEFQNTQGWNAPREKIRPVQAAFANERIAARGSAQGPGRVAIADTFFPGWRASVNGAAAPVVPDSVVFRAVAATGEFDLRMIYRPLSFQVGLLLSLLAAGCAAALGYFKLRSFAPGES